MPEDSVAVFILLGYELKFPFESYCVFHWQQLETEWLGLFLRTTSLDGDTARGDSILPQIQVINILKT